MSTGNGNRVKTLEAKKWQLMSRNAANKFLKGVVTVRICGDVALVVTQDDSVFMVGDKVADEYEEEQEWNKNKRNTASKKKKKKKKCGLVKIDFLCGRRITEFVIGGGNWPEMERSAKKEADPEAERQRRPTRTSIPGRSHFYLALTESGDLYSWGVNNQGQLGRGGGGGEEATPARILSLSQETIVQAAAGTAHCLALTANGKVFGWGLNEAGQCGSDKKVVAHLTPTPVHFGHHSSVNVKSVYCGSSHSAALTTDGQVYCWGRNGRGQLGMGDLEDRSKPSLVVDLSPTPIAELALGALHTLALEAENMKVYAFGRNDNRALVVPSQELEVTRPTLVNRLHRIDRIFAFHDSNISLASKKKATFIWGYELPDNKPLKTPRKKRKTLLEISYKLMHTPCFTIKTVN